MLKTSPRTVLGGVGAILCRPCSDPAPSCGPAAGGPAAYGAAGDPSYQSLYSAEPPTNATNGAGNSKAARFMWRKRRVKPDTK